MAEISTQKIERLITQFENQTLTKEEWTHEAHLIIGIHYSMKLSFYESICVMKSGIILLNQAHDTTNTISSGYHETITVLWIKTIRDFITEYPSLPIEGKVNQFLSSSHSEKDYLFHKYKREVILSTKARAICVIDIDEN